MVRTGGSAAGIFLCGPQTFQDILGMNQDFSKKNIYPVYSPNLSICLMSSPCNGPTFSCRNKSL